MKKTRITSQEYLTLCGLFFLAQEAEKKTTECIKTMEKILGIPKKDSLGSHISDAIYSGDSLDVALEKMDIVDVCICNTIPMMDKLTTCPAHGNVMLLAKPDKE